MGLWFPLFLAPFSRPFCLAIKASPVTLRAGTVARLGSLAWETNKKLHRYMTSEQLRMFSHYEVMLRAWRDEINARQAAGDRPEARSHADIIPMILHIDPARVSPDLREVPEVLRCRFLDRPFCQVVEVDPDDLSELSFLEPWQRKQLAGLGFALLALPSAPIRENPRGRRLLDQVETQLRETLALWIWALTPSIDSLAAIMPETGEGVSPGLGFLAQRAPWLSRMAEESLARRPDGDADTNRADPTDRLHGLIARLSEEGRTVRLTLREANGTPHVHFGTAVQDIYLARTTALLRSPKARAGVRARALAYAGLLETSPKQASRPQPCSARRSPQPGRSSRAWMRSPGKGPSDILRTESGKRLRNAATKVIRSAQAPQYVQAPGNGASTTLSLREMAIAAFFAGVDPYTICGQHLIFAGDILSAKALGDGMLGRRNVESHELGPITALLAWDQWIEPCATGWEQQLAEVRDAVDAAGQLVSFPNGQ